MIHTNILNTLQKQIVLPIKSLLKLKKKLKTRKVSTKSTKVKIPGCRKSVLRKPGLREAGAKTLL